MTAIYGNYKGYQGSSRITTGESTSAHVVDERLTLVNNAIPGIFSDVDVLDIGCNDGRITVGVALHYNPATIIGIDADEKLIQKAKSHLSFRWSRLGPNGEIDYFPASSVEAAGHIPYARNDKSQLPSKVLFHCSGFLECDPIPFPETASVDGNDGARFGVVMMLSVIKWIHLEHGDRGVDLAFRKVSSMLHEGGYFVFEPQGWDSYASAVKKFPALHMNKECLQIRPEDFKEILESVGLELVKEIGGRKRSIYIYRKSAVEVEG